MQITLEQLLVCLKRFGFHMYEVKDCTDVHIGYIVYIYSSVWQIELYKYEQWSGWNVTLRQQEFGKDSRMSQIDGDLYLEVQDVLNLFDFNIPKQTVAMQSF